MKNFDRRSRSLVFDAYLGANTAIYSPHDSSQASGDGMYGFGRSGLGSWILGGEGAFVGGDECLMALTVRIVRAQ